MKFKVYREVTDCSGSSLLIIFDLIKMRFHYSFLETSTTIIKKKLLGHDYREVSFKEKLHQGEKGGQVSRRQF